MRSLLIPTTDDKGLERQTWNSVYLQKEKMAKTDMEHPYKILEIMLSVPSTSAFEAGIRLETLRLN